MNYVNRRKVEKSLDEMLGGGLSVGDFVPWLGTVGKIAGSLTGGGNDQQASQQAALMQQMQEQQRQAAAAKAAADASRTQMIMFGGIGAVALVGLALFLKSK